MIAVYNHDVRLPLQHSSVPDMEEPSTSTHVDINYFNPDSARELQRIISRSSVGTQDIELASTGSAATLQAFDFRKTLEDISQQYVSLQRTRLLA